MVDHKIITEWLSKADEDFDFAAISLNEGNNFYAQICFHFQQAAEKYLKTFIIAYDLEFDKIHNLVALLKKCAAKENSLLSLLDYCIFLNTFYIDTRYPVHWPVDHTKEKALKAKEYAGKIAAAVKNILFK